MKKHNKILIVILAILVIMVGFAFVGDRMYKSNLELNIAEEGYSIEVAEGTVVQDVINVLVKDEVVKSEFMTKAYLKMNDQYYAVMAGSYYFEKGTTLEQMWKDFSTGQQEEFITLQLLEGESLTVYATNLATALGDSSRSQEILDFWNSPEFVNAKIEQYECITDAVLDPEIYFPLEGYFKPDTYFFGEKDFTFENLDFISTTILDERQKDYDKFVDSYGYNDYTTNFHEVLTLASIIEREATSYEDRQMVAGIFINRIKNGDSLGSDITTYYAEQVPIYERDLYQDELDAKNGYNTRGPLIGLPVGAVNNPSSISVEAVLNYTDNDYYYFVSDKNGKMYYTKTFAEHEQLIADLKSQGLWFTWEE